MELPRSFQEPSVLQCSIQMGWWGGVSTPGSSQMSSQRCCQTRWQFQDCVVDVKFLQANAKNICISTIVFREIMRFHALQIKRINSTNPQFQLYIHTLVFLDGPKPQDPPSFKFKLQRRGACLASVLDATVSPGQMPSSRGSRCLDSKVDISTEPWVFEATFKRYPLVN